MTTPCQPTTASPVNDDERFTLGLFLDLCAVLQDHGFSEDVKRRENLMALQLHLFHFLYGTDDGQRCYGGAMGLGR
jgi:hypothetical protein